VPPDRCPVHPGGHSAIGPSAPAGGTRRPRPRSRSCRQESRVEATHDRTPGAAQRRGGRNAPEDVGVGAARQAADTAQARISATIRPNGLRQAIGGDSVGRHQLSLVCPDVRDSRRPGGTTPGGPDRQHSKTSSTGIPRGPTTVRPPTRRGLRQEDPTTYPLDLLDPGPSARLELRAQRTAGSHNQPSFARTADNAGLADTSLPLTKLHPRRNRTRPPQRHRHARLRPQVPTPAARTPFESPMMGASFPSP
jgi:hypothetical protein